MPIPQIYWRLGPGAFFNWSQQINDLDQSFQETDLIV